METIVLKKDEIAVSKDELDVYKNAVKELSDIKKAQASMEAEQLAAYEIELGLYDEVNLSSRKDLISHLSQQERKVLSDTLNRLKEVLSDKSEEEEFLSKLPQELKGSIPPALRKYIEGKKKKKGPEEEEMAHKPDDDMDDEKKKKYPYPENQSQKLQTEKLSIERERLSLRKPGDLDRWQKRAEINRQANQEFIDFMMVQQGDGALVGRH